MMIMDTESQSNVITLTILLIIVIFIIARRMQKGIQGRKFAGWRIVFFPLLYILITLYVVELDWKDFGIYIDISISLLLVIGLMTGLKFGGSVSFFKKGNDLYFKRSPYIISIWAVSFIARITIEYVFPQLLLYTEVVDGLLVFTSGLVVGETFHILTKKKKYEENITES